MLCMAPSNLVLNASRIGVLTTSLTWLVVPEVLYTFLSLDLFLSRESPAIPAAFVIANFL